MYLAMLKDEVVTADVLKRFRGATNMTDKIAMLATLADTPGRDIRFMPELGIHFTHIYQVQHLVAVIGTLGAAARCTPPYPPVPCAEDDWAWRMQGTSGRQLSVSSTRSGRTRCGGMQCHTCTWTDGRVHADGMYLYAVLCCALE